MAIGILNIEMEISGCISIKDKRSRLKPLIHRIHRKFNVSIAEVGLENNWNKTLIAVVMVNPNKDFLQRCLVKTISFIDRYFNDFFIQDHRIEII